VAAGFVWGRGDNPFLVHIIPRHMLAYVWLRFAVVIGGDARVRSCGFCGRWILIEPPDSRVTRRYCDNACRQKHYQSLARQQRLKQESGSRTRRVNKKLRRSTKPDALKQGRKS
jgi:hypothetical protein